MSHINMNMSSHEYVTSSICHISTLIFKSFGDGCLVCVDTSDGTHMHGRRMDAAMHLNRDAFESQCI